MTASDLLIESQYLPPVPVFSEIIKHNGLYWEANENYQKQTYRNRCYILTSSGIQLLTVPVSKIISRSIKDIKIDYSQNWQQIHIGSLKAAYGKSAFFEYYFEGFEKIIMSKCVFLFDLNLEMMTKCLSILKISKKIEFTASFLKLMDNPFYDKRGLINPDSTFPLEDNKSDKYYQLFGNKFVKNLSIIDLIMNEGTNAPNFLYNN